jgi:hypothetical protein
MPAAQESKPQDPPVLTTTQARQGFRGRHVLIVLAVSMALIVVIYAVMVGGLWNGRLSQPGGQTQVDQATLNQKGFQAPLSQPRQTATSPANGAEQKP